MAIDSYNDTSTAVTPAKTGSTGGGTASEKNPRAVGTPELQKSDGLSSPRVTVKTIQAEASSTPKGSKGNAPVTHYSDSEV